MRLTLVFCLIFCFSLNSLAADNKNNDLESTSLDKRTLAGVLHLYQRAGYQIVFSNSLVKDSLIVEFNPPAGEPIARLKEVLKWLNLDLQYQDEIKSWFVVASQTHFLTVTLSISDSQTAKPIAGVTVNNALLPIPLAAVSDSEGHLTVTVDTTNTPCIQLQAPKYHNECAKYRVGYSLIKVTMSRTQDQLEEIIVTSQYHFEKAHNDSGQTFNSTEIQAVPILGGDSLQIINSLPGIASQGFSAKPYIRGGTQDELLVLFDGIELIDPFHIKDYQNLLSGISPDIVESIQIHTGGYPANYGGKMSGVMEIKSPELPDAYSYNFGITPYTTSVKTSGANERETFAWSIAARNGILDETLEQVNDNIGSTGFDDLYVSTRWGLKNTVKFEATYLALRDDINLTSLDGDIGEALRSVYNSKYGWFKINFQHNNSLDNQITLTVADILNDRNGFVNEPDNPSESIGSLMDRRSFHINRIEYNLSYRLSPIHSIDAGIKFEVLEGNYQYVMATERGQLSTLLGLPENVTHNLHVQPKGNARSLFLSYRYVPSDIWSIETGLRVDTQDYYEGDSEQISPRSAIRLKLSDTVHAKLNLGRFYQAPGINDLNIESGNTQFHPPQKSDHFIAGIVYDSPQGLSLTLESYRKDVFAPRPRFENAFHPYVFIPELATDRILIEPKYAKIRGHEALIEYSGFENLHLWGSISQSYAKDILSDNSSINRPWDQHYTLQSGFTYAYNNWTLGSRLHWHSGWRTTQFPDSVNDLNNPVPYKLFENRLPDFFSLDLKLSYFWSGKKGLLEAYIEVINLTAHDNIGYYELDFSENIDESGYDVESEANKLLPLIPSFGISWQF